MIAVVAGLVCSSAASAATFTVVAGDNGDSGGSCDGGACSSLRAAIAAANAAADGSTVTIAAGLYVLLQGELKITASMTIVGARSTGDPATVIEQRDPDGGRVLEVAPTSGATVTIDGVALDGGQVSGSGADRVAGGGLLVDAGATATAIEMTGDMVDGNTVTGDAGSGGGRPGTEAAGGGIAVEGADVSLDLADSTIEQNTVIGGAGASGLGGIGGAAGNATGGGIAFGSTGDAGGSLTITDSTISGNTVTDGGGGSGDYGAGNGGVDLGGGVGAGSQNPGSVMTIRDSTLSDNTVRSGDGGDSTVGTSGSGGDGLGGGVAFASAGLLDGDEISGNAIFAPAAGPAAGTASVGQGGAAEGGGVAFLGGEIDGGGVVDASTIADNSVIAGQTGESGGGGVAQLTGSSTTPGYPVSVVNSTIFHNAAVPPSNGPPRASSAGGLLATGPLTLASDTLDGNSAGPAGDGGNLGAEYGTLTVANTIIAGGIGANGTSNCDLQYTPVGAGNLEDDGAAQCGFTTTNGDLVGVDPQLASMPAANGGALDGGPALTLALAASSPAHDAGGAGGTGGACTNPLTGGPLTVDERGQPRTGTCDIGAYQIEAPSEGTPPATTGAAGPGETPTAAPPNDSGQPEDTGSASPGPVAPPVLSRVRLAPGTFPARRGTKLELTLSRAATVKVVVDQAVGSHGRDKPRATLSFRAPAGPIRRTFLIPRLEHGTYAATITATAGATTSTAVRRSFKISRPRGQPPRRRSR
ncbi:MAG TPA: choice-of-anchor Q domain-containing protein [Solirubrobacteraceae bacterium]|nr:choice-of-anchor Q domain-containing protein [Solirubrobacteraceae bacterium]